MSLKYEPFDKGGEKVADSAAFAASVLAAHTAAMVLPPYPLTIVLPLYPLTMVLPPYPLTIVQAVRPDGKAMAIEIGG